MFREDPCLYFMLFGCSRFGGGGGRRPAMYLPSGFSICPVTEKRNHNNVELFTINIGTVLYFIIELFSCSQMGGEGDEV